MDVLSSNDGSGGGALLDAPRKLGRYELIGRLGTGGMASVYLARTAGEAGFQRLFAIKVLHPHLADYPGFVSMLLDEARIAARLHHPNVVPIVDLGAHHKTHYVAMEYVEGCSLWALEAKTASAPWPHLLVPLVLDMLAGLEAAHALCDDTGAPMNLVHRDVSPQNVLVGIDGMARLADFGIARAESRLITTRPGEIKGKLAYMSPEQLRSATIDRRSDLFSAGCMLWSMLTGQRLFEGDNDAATVANIMGMEVPRPSTVGFRPAPVFDEVCLRALQRDPDQRYATAAEMEDALRAAATSLGPLGSRREISAWVTATFRVEIAGRRAAIAQAAAESPSQHAHGAVAPATPVLPSFTPPSISDASEGSSVVDVSHAPTAVPPAPAIARPPTAAAPEPRRRSRAVILGVASACVAVVLLWTQLRSPAPARSAQPRGAGVAQEPVAAPDPVRAADHAAALYLDEAEQLLAAHRIDAAKELVERAKREPAADPELVVRRAKIGERVVDAELRARARRATDRAAAIEAAQQLLERNPDDREAAELLAAARGAAAGGPTTTTGTLTVETRAGAAVYLDDHLIARGSFSQPVPAGPHVVVVRQAGFSPQRRSIEIAADHETRLALTLATAPAHEAATAAPAAGTASAAEPPAPTTPSAPAPAAPDPVAQAGSAAPQPDMPAAALVAAVPVTPPRAPAPPPRATPAPPAQVAPPRLPASYSATNMKELGKVLAVIEGEAIARGGAPASLRGVTRLLAEEAFASFAPGSAIEIHPSAIYYAIVRAARAGKSAQAIAGELRAGHAQGAL